MSTPKTEFSRACVSIAVPAAPLDRTSHLEPFRCVPFGVFSSLTLPLANAGLLACSY